MSFSKAALAGATATIAAAAAIITNEDLDRRAAARFAAASLETLLNAIDANDADTGAHVRRVATYALILAEFADLTKADQRMVERVALFHDIGKIHEALFDIIHEDRTLTPAERRSIITHPQRGADVLAPLSGFYPELPEGVLSHHERWNGTGYPRGLKAGEIPAGGRILAVVDAYERMTVGRVHRPAGSREQAFDELRRLRGRQFDPEVVDAFERMIPVLDGTSEALAPETREADVADAGR